MTDKTDEKYLNTDAEELDNICDECKEEDESVTQNLILLGLNYVNLVEYLRLFFHFN